MTDDQTEIIMELQKLAIATIAKRDARIAELEAALKPFAHEAASHSDKIPNEMYIDDYQGVGQTTIITVGDLRAARAALGEKE
jgi:hypothetical protein